jgi:type IV secretory pathway VirB2 component (pilin)
MPLRLAALITAAALLTTSVTAQDFSSVAGFESWALNLLQKLLTMFGDFLVMLLREVFAGLQSLLGQAPASVPVASPSNLIPLAPIDIKH